MKKEGKKEGKWGDGMAGWAWPTASAAGGGQRQPEGVEGGQ